MWWSETKADFFRPSEVGRFRPLGEKLRVSDMWWKLKKIVFYSSVSLWRIKLY